MNTKGRTWQTGVTNKYEDWGKNGWGQQWPKAAVVCCRLLSNQDSSPRITTPRIFPADFRLWLPTNNIPIQVITVGTAPDRGIEG